MRRLLTLGLLQLLLVLDQAWTSVSMDFIEGFPKSEGKDSVLVVVDRFTKFARFIGLAHPYTTQEVVRAFMDRIVGFAWGAEGYYIEQRQDIHQHLLVRIDEVYWIKLHMSIAYHPQIDGETERVNQNLKTYLTCICILHPNQWHRWLALALSQVYATTKAHRSLNLAILPHILSSKILPNLKLTLSVIRIYDIYLWH